jgi:hypothetical protein
MATATRVGRVIGVLLLLQMLGGLLVNFVLLAPVFAGPGFLVNAAGHSLQIAVAALIGVATGVISLAIAITASPVFRQCSRAMTLWLVALAVANLCLTAVEQTGVMSMLSLSEAYAKANATDAGLFEALQVMVRSARTWAHYMNLIIAGGMLLVFYGILYRFALVPRVLAAFGLATVILQITVVAMPFFGQGIVFPMLFPLALTHLILALWLIAKGFPAAVPPGGQGNA